MKKIAISFHSARVENFNIFYRQAGDPASPAILLLHGFPTSSHMFRNLIPQLAEDFYVIAPDLPGFGFSDAPDRKSFSYAFERVADVIGRFIEGVGLEKFAIYVFDYGAPVGFRLALRFPDRISAIISQNGNAYVEGLIEDWAPVRAYWENPTPHNRDALRKLSSLETTRWQYHHGVAEPEERVAPEAIFLDQPLLNRPQSAEIQLDLIGDYKSNIALYPKFQEFSANISPPLWPCGAAMIRFFCRPGRNRFVGTIRKRKSCFTIPDTSRLKRTQWKSARRFVHFSAAYLANAQNRTCTVKVISFYNSLPVEDPQSFAELSAEEPTPEAHDLFVEVRAISVNPVDAKIRAGGGPGKPQGKVQILGWDAAGIVRQVGADVTLFRAGDEVYYAGSIDRPGCYAEFQCVDERIVGRKPSTLSFAEAAALPLTTITGWELLFDRLRINEAMEGSLLILGGAGGVGSIATQLARQLTRLTVISTASRPETRDWCQHMGAHHVIDHSQPLAAQIEPLASGGVDYVLALTKAEDHFDQLIEAMSPQSAMALIENPARPLEITKLKPKSISLHWEFMFTRSRYQTPDMAEQGRLLNQVAALVDAGRILTTMRTDLGEINAANLRCAHNLVESGKTIGKIVLSGFGAKK
jgi:NADPH2:quinone reductase